MINVNENTIKEVIEYLDIVLQNTENIDITKECDNFKAMIDKKYLNKLDIVSIYCAVHKYRLKKKINLLTLPRKDKTKNELKYKIQILNLFHDIALFYVNNL